MAGWKQQRRHFRTEAEAIAYTVRLMSDLAREGQGDPAIRALGVQIVGHACAAPAVERDCMARAIYDFIRERLVFVPDPAKLELVADPVFTIYQAGGGDCDDLAVAYGSLALAVGLHVGWLLGSSRADATGPTHVLPAVRSAGDGWIPAEVSADPREGLGGQAPINFGVMPPGFQIFSVVPV